MNRQQILFGLVSGAILSACGAYLAASGIADWSLFVVGLMLSAIALVSRPHGEVRDTSRMRPVKVLSNARSGAD